MLNADEIIDTGFAVLKNARPKQNAGHLAERARRQMAQAKRRKTFAALATGISALGIAAIALQPQSALASLKESARLTANQPIVHLHIDRHSNSSSPDWPPVPSEDIWRFPHRYIRKQGHGIYEAYRDGRTFSYDDRFSSGFRGTYYAAKDPFWKFEGTISLELSEAHQSAPTEQTVVRNGKEFIEYDLHQTDGVGNKTTGQIYVDPKTKLVRFIDEHWVAPNGDSSHSTGTVDYPDSVSAEREAPRFSAGMNFHSKEELIEAFDHSIGHVVQVKSVGGIRVRLYGVIVYPNSTDGIGILVITQGGTPPDDGTPQSVEIIGQKLLPEKRLDYFQWIDKNHVRFGRPQTIDGQQYLVDQSEDLLYRAPTRLTIRVPVWRSGGSGSQLVGYVTFTTSKLFYNTGEGDWNFYRDQ